MKFNQSLLIKKPHYTIGVYGWLTSWLTGAPVTWRRRGSAGGPGQLNLSFRGSRETAVYFSGRWPTNFQFRDNWLVDGDENWKLNYCEKKKSNFSWMFLNPDIFFPISILIVLIYHIWETSRNKLKKNSVTKNCSDLSLFSLRLTVDQNNFGNKIPVICMKFNLRNGSLDLEIGHSSILHLHGRKKLSNTIKIKIIKEHS